MVLLAIWLITTQDIDYLHPVTITATDTMITMGILLITVMDTMLITITDTLLTIVTETVAMDTIPLHTTSLIRPMTKNITECKVLLI